MNFVQDRKKYQLLFILLMSFFLVLTFPGLAKAETDTASTGAANAATISSQTTSPAPAGSEAAGLAKASTGAASVANDVPNSGKATSGMSPSGDNKPSLPQAEEPQVKQASSNEKPDVTEVSTEKVQTGDASQAEKDAKEKATAGATDKEKTPSGDASQAEKEKASAGDPAQAEEGKTEKDATGITDKEKASTDNPAQAEEENPEAIDPAQVDADITENEDSSQLKNETAEALPSTKEAEVLEKGETLEVESLAKAPMALGAGAGNGQKTIEVKSFKELKKAIEDAGTEPTTIVITESFTLTETLKIRSDQNITITSGADQNKNKVTPIGQDQDKITLPTDKHNTVESRKKLVDEAEKKGEKALEYTDLSKNPLPKIDEVDYVLTRDKDFTGTLFEIQKDGTLTLGTDNKDPLFIDGNKDVKTNLPASFIEVKGTLVMNGGFIANGNNELGSSAPILIRDGGEFTMNGGRITSNKNISYLKKPDNSWLGAMHATGGVYIEEGGTFTMNAGSIDNNTARVGGVFLGNFGSTSGSNKKPAEFIMNGGYIANNKMSTHEGMDSRENQGGGVNVNSNAKFTFNNGIIAGNESHHGGGITVNDNYVFEYYYSDNQGSGRTNLSSSEKYEDYIKHSRAYYEQNGGLIYNNKAKVVEGSENFSGVGGGIYLNSSTTKFNGGYLLNNTAENMGGGIYVSVAPIVLELDHTLVTKNEAINNGKQYQYDSGNGGGYWNCPIGTVNFEDFNSLYIFENSASKFGQDISALIKASEYYIQRGSNQDYKSFTTYLSSLTEKGNIIRYRTRYQDDPGNLYYTNDGVEVTTIYDDKAKEEAWTNSNVFIIGNVALKGGGIGSNANLEAPGKPGNYELVVEKKWDKSVPDYKIPESLVVELYIGDNKYGQIELSKDNGWIGKFKKLPFTPQELAKKNLKYSVKEKDDKFYAVVEEGDKTSLEVERIWANTTLSNGFTYDPKPTDVKHSEKIIFIYKDKDGKEIKREDIKVSNLEADGERWTAFVKNGLFAGLKNLDNVKITYHDFDTPYIWSGYYGLDGKSDWKGSGPWHEAYVLEKADGTIEIQLPYIWAQRMNGVGRTDKYSKNKSGYRLGLVNNYTFTITNYPYSEIPVSKKWDDSIGKKDIPDQVKVYLLKDGKRVKDKDGNDRYVLLNEGNNWEAIFEKLPYFGIKGMEFEKYWVKEDSEIFIPLIIKKENRPMDIDIERVDSDYADYISEKYWIDKDYTGGIFNIEGIPFEVHYYKDGKIVGKYSQIMEKSSGPDYRWHLKMMIKDIIVQGHYKDSDLEIKPYYDENGNPFPRNLGKYKEAAWQEDFIINKGSYVLKVVEENGKLVIYVPKITDKEDDYNLFVVGASIEPKGSFELTNHYLPKHRIEIKKIWDVINSSSIPKNLKVKVQGKYVDKEVTLSPEEWKYVEEFLGKGLLATNKYAFTEEELANFNGTQSIETSLEFTAKDKTVTFLDQDGKAISQEDFLKRVKVKDYSFELKEAADDKAEVEMKYDADGNLVIVYPVDVTITEVAKVLFKNTENPPGGTPGSNTRIIRVTKAWDLAGHENPVSEITVELYRDGQATGKQVKLNADNNWTSSFAGLEIADKANPAKKYQYTIKEVGDINGLFEYDGKKFEVSYTGDMFTGFTITNKEIPEEPPETPEEPPKTPEEPPVTPPETPEEPPVVPQTPPTVPEAPGKAPQTGLPANGELFLLMAMGLVGLRLSRRRKRTDGQ